jgi:hypothetical protein
MSEIETKLAATLARADDLERRWNNQNSFIESFAKCLDGLPVNQIPGSLIDGARDAGSIRLIVEALLERAERAEKACAEKHSILSSWQLTWAETYSTDFLLKVKHALSLDCGKDYRHVRELDKTIEVLEKLRLCINPLICELPDGNDDLREKILVIQSSAKAEIARLESLKGTK